MTNPFMRKAIDLAIDNVRSGQGGPFGAVVVREGKILAEGTNRVTSLNDPTAHAEVVAIREACRILGSFELAGCEIYASCEPCPMCLGAIYWARLVRVYFAGTRKDAAEAGFDDEFVYQQIQLPIAARKIPMIRLMREQALEAFEEWKRKPDKIPY